jgi:hypothetical protein
MIMRSPQSFSLDKILKYWILLSAAALLITPFIVIDSIIFPFVVGKAVWVRIVVSVILALSAIYVTVNVRVILYKSKLILVLLLYVSVSLLSSVSGVDPEHSIWSDIERMYGVMDEIHLFALSIALSWVVTTNLSWNILLNILYLVGLFLSIVIISQSYGTQSIPILDIPLHTTDGRASGPTGNPTFAGEFIMLSGLVCISLLVERLFFFNKQPSNNDLIRIAFYGLSVLIFLYAVTLTGSRAAFLSFAVGIAVVFAVTSTARSRLSFSTVLLYIFLVFLFYFMGSKIDMDNLPNNVLISRVADTFLKDGGGNSIKARIELVSAGVKSAADHPVLGVGPNNFSVVYERYAEKEIFEYHPQYIDNSHSKPVEELATKGLPGFIVYSLLWFFILHRCVAGFKYSKETAALHYGLLGVFVSYFVHNLFHFESHSTLIIFAILLGWLIFQERQQADLGWVSSKAQTKMPLRYTLFVAVIALTPSAVMLNNSAIYGPLRSASLSYKAVFQPGLDTGQKLRSIYLVKEITPELYPHILRIFIDYTVSSNRINEALGYLDIEKALIKEAEEVVSNHQYDLRLHQSLMSLYLNSSSLNIVSKQKAIELIDHINLLSPNRNSGVKLD